MALKIIIEKHTQEQHDGSCKEFFYIKYKSGWWAPWRYLKDHYFYHSDPENKEFSTLSQAREEAHNFRREKEGLTHKVDHLDELGRPILGTR